MGFLAAIGAFWGKHDRTILTTVTVSGVIASVAIALKDRPKYEEILWDCEEEGLTKPETARELGRAAGPLVLAVGVTIGATVWNHIRTGKKLKDLADTASGALSAYMVGKTIQDEYRKYIGEEEANKIERKVSNMRADQMWETASSSPNTIVRTGHGSESFVDEFTGLTLEGSWNWFEKCANKADHDVRTEMWIPASDVYLDWGVPANKIPAVLKELGWNVDDGPIELLPPDADFDEDTGRPYGILRWRTKPIYRFERRRY